MPASLLLMGSTALLGADPCCAPAPISCPDACAPKIACNSCQPACGSPLFSRPLFKGHLLARLKSLKSSPSCGCTPAPVCDPCTTAAPASGCALPAMPVPPAQPAQPAAPSKEAPKQMPKPEAPKTPEIKKSTLAPMTRPILEPVISVTSIPSLKSSGAY